MGKTEGGEHSGRKNKSNSRMNYLRQVKQGGGGGGGGRGGWRGGGGGGDYVSAYGRDGQKKQKRQCIGPGMRGFLLTTGFRDTDCVRDGYNLLNEYYRPEDEIKGDTGTTAGEEGGGDIKSEEVEGQPIKDEPKTDECQEGASSNSATVGSTSTPASDDKVAVVKPEADDDEDDIDKSLEKEMKELRSNTTFKFQSVDTGIRGMVFIKTILPRPSEIAYRILDDVFEKKETRCRNILRFVPIEGTCRSDNQSIRQLAKEIFTPYFDKGCKSFKVVLNMRHSNLNKYEIIDTLAGLVTEINPLTVVNLTDPEYTILAEVIRSTICLTVLRDFIKFKKFNITEIVSPTPLVPPKPKSEPVDPDQGHQVEEAAAPISPTKNSNNEETRSAVKVEVIHDKDVAIKDEPDKLE